jgi:hypothetical protein
MLHAATVRPVPPSHRAIEALMSDVVNPEFHATTNTRLDSMIDAFYEATPAARYLATAGSIDKHLIARHTIETILRIRLLRCADSKVIQYFTRLNPYAAQKWCKYTGERMLHDRLFLKDLRTLGVSDEAVYGTEPLLATELLQGYRYYTLEHEGPRGLLSEAYFAEYTFKTTLAVWNANLRRALGEQAVQGAEAHRAYHLEEDHVTEVWNVLMSVVKTPDDEARVHYHLDAYYGLFLAYFNELASATHVDVSGPPPDPAGTAVWAAQRAALLGSKNRDTE